MGVKLFAWIGGLALFLGVAFFVKYSFDNNLISRELRVAIGFVTGLGLLVGGVVMSRKNYAVLSQTLCATGVVILYAVTFACRAYYQFPFFGPLPTFLLMVLITATAFLLADRLKALVVAILGMLGGFLTPVLLSTGQDNPLGLFGYIAILDAGLIVVALNRRWHFLTALAAAGTAFMQIGWAGKFFETGKYFEGDKILVALAVLLGFNVLYLAAAGAAKRRGSANKWLSGSTFGLVAVALVFTAWFLSFAPLAQRPWLMFGFVFLIDLIVTTLVLLDDEIAPAQPIAGLAVFGLLAAWTAHSLTNDLLNAALAFYFIFAIVHSVFPVLLQRRRGINPRRCGGARFFHRWRSCWCSSPFSSSPSFVHRLAVRAAGGCAGHRPGRGAGLPVAGADRDGAHPRRHRRVDFQNPRGTYRAATSFFLLGVFAIFFVAVSVWAVRKLKPDLLTKASRRSTCATGKHGRALAGVLGHSPVFAAHHGHVAVATGKSVAGLRAGPAPDCVVAGRGQDVFPGLAVCHRTGLRRGAGMRVAFQPV